MKNFIVMGFLSVFPFCLHGQAGQKRLALVIGNSQYQFTTPLKNPVNDARAVASSLQSLGFEVLEHENVTQGQMKQAINAFGEKLKGYDVGLFYYAGHGVQSQGVNYMIPIEAELKNEEQIEFDCVAADRVLAFMETAATKVNLIVLDACRNNPFGRSWQRSAGGGGLAMMDAPKGSLIAYATSPGHTASDGESTNGLYTSALLKFMRNPSLTIEQVFKQVRNEVSDKSGGSQIPWETTSLTGEDFYLGRGAMGDLSKQIVASDERIQQKQNAQARSHVDLTSVKVSEADKAQAEIFFAQGKVSYEAFKDEKAIQEFSKAIQLNPRFADAYYSRGLACYDLKEYDKAVEDFNISIELNPKSYQTYYWRANTYRSVRQDDKALSDFDKSIALNATYAEAYYWKGRTVYDLMEDEKSIESFNKAIQLKPQYSDAIYWRGQAYYDLKKYELAIADYTFSLQLKPDDADAYFWRAKSYFSLKRYAEAIQDFNSSLALKPGYVEAYFYRGKVKYNIAQYNESLADFVKASELNPKYADAFYWQGYVNYVLKNDSATIVLCSKAIEINPRHADALYYRALGKYGFKK